MRRTALEQRVYRLKVAALAVAAGAWLALWALVTGAVAGTAAAPSMPAASGEQTQATDLFGSILASHPHDGPSRTLHQRCADYLEHAPDAWDGVHVMKTK